MLNCNEMPVINQGESKKLPVALRNRSNGKPYDLTDATEIHALLPKSTSGEWLYKKLSLT